MSDDVFIRKETLVAMGDSIRASNEEEKQYSLSEMVSDLESLKRYIEGSIGPSFTIPNGVTLIKKNAFYNCANLTQILIPEGITTIEDMAFYGCSQLEQVTFPESLVAIGTAFWYCSNLSSVTFKGTPSKINLSAFPYCSNLTTINVPWSEGEVANAPWGANNATINYNYTGEGGV